MLESELLSLFRPCRSKFVALRDDKDPREVKELSGEG